jgi:hypothetical protein
MGRLVPARAVPAASSPEAAVLAAQGRGRQCFNAAPVAITEPERYQPSAPLQYRQIREIQPSCVRSRPRCSHRLRP